MVKVTTKELQQQFGALCDRVTATGEAIVIEDPEKPLVALVSAEDYELLRRIEYAADLEMVQRVKSEGGETVPWEKLKAELGL